MRRWMLAAVVGPALVMGTLAAFAAQAQGAWKSYVVKELGILLCGAGQGRDKHRHIPRRSRRPAPDDDLQIVGEQHRISRHGDELQTGAGRRRRDPGRTHLHVPGQEEHPDGHLGACRAGQGRGVRPEDGGRAARGQRPHDGGVLFHQGQAHPARGDVLPANGDYQSPDPARFIDSIAFNIARAGRAPSSFRRRSSSSFSHASRMKNKRGGADEFQRLASLAALAATAFAVPANAHHSFSMFDADEDRHVESHRAGHRVGEPACVAARDGSRIRPGHRGCGRSRWGRLPRQLRRGWKPDSVRHGDVITVNYHPLKDGSRGGQLVSAILADGKSVGGAGAADQN